MGRARRVRQHLYNEVVETRCIWAKTVWARISWVVWFLPFQPGSAGAECR